MNYYVHNIDPTILQFGLIQVRWYGLMYLLGFILGYYQIKWRYKKGYTAITPIVSQDLITYLMIGMILGARLAYVTIYNWAYYKDHLLEALMIWKGGLSFHGAAVGFAIAMYFFAKKHNLKFWHIADQVVLCGTIGIMLGRIGNFTNGELWGRTTDVAWAIVFPSGGPSPRHPSQLYESLGEGLILFLVLVLLDKYERSKQLAVSEADKKGNRRVVWQRSGLLASTFIMGYGIARFVVEFYRQPDQQLGFYFGWMSMGQILCSIMIIIGILMIWWNIKNPTKVEYDYNPHLKV